MATWRHLGDRNLSGSLTSLLLLGLVAACSGSASVSPLSSPRSSFSPEPSTTWVESFTDLPFTFDLPEGWVFGSASEMASTIDELATANPEYAEKLQAVLDTSATPTSGFVAYDVGSVDPLTPSMSCSTLDRGATPIAETLDLGETQNVEAVADLPGLIGTPTSDRMALPVGETVRVHWRWTDPSGRGEISSIGHLFVSGPTIYTCVFSAGTSTIAAHEPEWEAILRTFKAEPAWYVSATIPVGVKPFSIAAGSDALWVANAEGGDIDRIDPSTNTVVATIGLHFEGSSGETANPWAITTGGSTVWVTSWVFDANGDDRPGLVNVIDAETNAELAPVEVGRLPAAITSGFGSVWVANQGDNSVSRIDEASHFVTATIGVGDRPQGVVACAGSVWVASLGNGLLARIDPTSNRVVATIEVSKSALAVACGRDGVWVAGTTASPDSDAPASDAESALYRVDPITNQIVAHIETGGGASGLATNNGSVWVTESLTRYVREIDEASVQVKAVVTLDTNSWGIAVLGDSVWVVQPAAADQKWAASEPGTVTRLDR
jgi:YVTN family beta-propeller protein